jgi:hypothetical protein
MDRHGTSRSSCPRGVTRGVLRAVDAGKQRAAVRTQYPTSRPLRGGDEIGRTEAAAALVPHFGDPEHDLLTEIAPKPRCSQQMDGRTGSPPLLSFERERSRLLQRAHAVITCLPTAS